MKISDIYHKIFSSEVKANSNSYREVIEFENIRNIILELDLVGKVNKKSTHELKAIALELLFLGSTEIRLIARSTNSLSKSLSKSILYISDGMHNLPYLIAYVENDEIEQSPFYTKKVLESEIINCISALIMNVRIKFEDGMIHDSYNLGYLFSKYFNLNEGHIQKLCSVRR